MMGWLGDKMQRHKRGTSSSDWLFWGIVLAVTLLPLTLGTVRATNNHGTPDLASEFAARHADLFQPVVVSGCTHSTSANYTSPSFACNAYTADGTYVAQPSASVNYQTLGSASTDVCWLAVHKQTQGAITGFTRQPGTHYAADCASTSRPADPTGGAVVGRAVITAGAITDYDVVAAQGVLGGEFIATRFPGADIGAKVNAALAAMPRYGMNSSNHGVEGGIVRIPAGEYVFSTPIVMTRQATCIQGEGLYTHNTFNASSEMAAGTVLRYTGAGNAITLGDSGTNQTQGHCLRNFKLIGIASATAIHVQTSSAWGIMEELHIVGPILNRTGIGISLEANSYGWRLRNLQIEHWGTGIQLDGNNGALMVEGTQVLRNTIGMVVGATSAVSGISITNSDFELNESWGIELRRTNNVNIAFNYMENGGSSFPGSRIIRIGGGAGETNNNITILGNYMHPGGSGVEYAIYVSRANGVTIANNSSPTAYATGVVENAAASLSNLRFLDNQFTGTTTDLSSFTGVTLYRAAAAGAAPNLTYYGVGQHRFGGTYSASDRGLIVDNEGNTSWDLALFKHNSRTGLQINGDAEIAMGRPVVTGTRLYVDGGGSTGDDMLMVKNNTLIGLNIQEDGIIIMEQLKTTGAASGKRVVCVDTADGRLYASSTGIDCSN